MPGVFRFLQGVLSSFLSVIPLTKEKSICTKETAPFKKISKPQHNDYCDESDPPNHVKVQERLPPGDPDEWANNNGLLRTPSDGTTLEPTRLIRIHPADRTPLCGVPIVRDRPRSFAPVHPRLLVPPGPGCTQCMPRTPELRGCIRAPCMFAHRLASCTHLAAASSAGSAGRQAQHGEDAESDHGGAQQSGQSESADRAGLPEAGDCGDCGATGGVHGGGGGDGGDGGGDDDRGRDGNDGAPDNGGTDKEEEEEEGEEEGEEASEGEAPAGGEEVVEDKDNSVAEEVAFAFASSQQPLPSSGCMSPGLLRHYSYPPKTPTDNALACDQSDPTENPRPESNWPDLLRPSGSSVTSPSEYGKHAVVTGSPPLPSPSPLHAIVPCSSPPLHAVVPVPPHTLSPSPSPPHAVVPGFPSSAIKDLLKSTMLASVRWAQGKDIPDAFGAEPTKTLRHSDPLAWLSAWDITVTIRSIRCIYRDPDGKKAKGPAYSYWVPAAREKCLEFLAKLHVTTKWVSRIMRFAKLGRLGRSGGTQAEFDVVVLWFFYSSHIAATAAAVVQAATPSEAATDRWISRSRDAKPVEVKFVLRVDDAPHIIAAAVDAAAEAEAEAEAEADPGLGELVLLGRSGIKVEVLRFNAPHIAAAETPPEAGAADPTEELDEPSNIEKHASSVPVLPEAEAHGGPTPALAEVRTAGAGAGPLANEGAHGAPTQVVQEEDPLACGGTVGDDGAPALLEARTAGGSDAAGGIPAFAETRRPTQAQGDRSPSACSPTPLVQWIPSWAFEHDDVSVGSAGPAWALVLAPETRHPLALPPRLPIAPARRVPAESPSQLFDVYIHTVTRCAQFRGHSPEWLAANRDRISFEALPELGLRGSGRPWEPESYEPFGEMGDLNDMSIPHFAALGTPDGAEPTADAPTAEALTTTMCYMDDPSEELFEPVGDLRDPPVPPDENDLPDAHHVPPPLDVPGLPPLDGAAPAEGASAFPMVLSVGTLPPNGQQPPTTTGDAGFFFFDQVL